jgi:hypothetical protein
MAALSRPAAAVRVTHRRHCLESFQSRAAIEFRRKDRDERAAELRIPLEQARH